MALGAKKVIIMKRALNLPQDVWGDDVQVVVPEAIVGAEKAEAMGVASQHGGARVWEIEGPMLRESREQTSFLQLFSHPARVTLEARKRAARFTAKRDLAERMPKDLR